MRRVFSIFPLLALTGSCLLLHEPAVAGDLVRETSWGAPGSMPGQFDYAVALDVGPDGSLYVLDAGNTRIQQFTPDGAFLNAFGKSAVVGIEGELVIPLSLATSPLGWVYVGDINRIHRYTASGALTDTYDRPGNLGETRGLTCDADGSLLVTDTMTGRVLRLSEAGEYQAEVDLSQFVSQPVGPYDVAVHASGEVYVLDIFGARVLVLDPSFSFLGVWSVHVVPDVYSEPYSIAVSENDIFVTDAHWFLRFDRLGNLTGEWGTPSDPDGRVAYGVFGIATSADGRVFVTTGENQVLRYGPAPVQTTFTTWGRLKALHR